MSTLNITYELCVAVMDGFKASYPQILRPDLLGLSVALDESGAPVLKMTVTEMGHPSFLKEVKLPKNFEIQLAGKKTGFKIVIIPIPVLPATQLSNKRSADRRKAPPTPPAPPLPPDEQ